MRQKRAKTYKRVMALYVQTFNFRQPFQVLVSDDILVLPASQQVDIIKLLSTCVQAEIKPMITQCCVEALYALGSSHQRTTNLAKSLERRRCNHRTALPSDECLADVIGSSNKHRYVLAAQSADLREKMDRIPGVPVIHFNGRGVAVLSPPGVATVREKVKGEEERRMGEKAAEDEFGAEGGNVITAKPGQGSGEIKGRGRKVAAPNPLSVRKKKGPAGEGKGGKGEEGDKKKKKRDRDGEEEEERIDLAEEGGDAGAAGRKKKKRKRRGKGEVALAIEELNATGLGGSRPTTIEGEGDGDESDV